MANMSYFLPSALEVVEKVSEPEMREERAREGEESEGVERKGSEREWGVREKRSTGDTSLIHQFILERIGKGL